MLNISGIEDILPRHQEISNGSKKDYTVAFDLIDTKFVSVYLGSEKQTTGYSVDIENKKVTFNSAPTTGLLVTIVRVVPASWESELHGALNSDSLNILFTKIIASLQTIKEEVSRSLKSNVFDENNSEQKFEFFLKQLADAQDVLNRSENNLSLLETTGQDSLNSINTARDNALEDIEEIRSETISEVTELTSSLLDYSNITNCITEIPQDIKLEIKDGVLTLKGGSAYYMPDGTKYIISSDKTTSSRISAGEESHLICINPTNNGWQFRNILNCTSGAGATAKSGFAYDTTTNKIGYYSSQGELQTDNCSLPIAIVRTDSSGYISSIIQIFNGFGYIGSTVYALPGVKLLRSNGRNADGTLRNNEVILTTVLTNSAYRPSTNGYLICAGNATSIQKSAEKSNWYYDEDNNYVSTLKGDKSWMIWGEYTTDINDIITSFQPKLPFRAVDYNDMQLKQDEATAVNYDNITNCIIEIPQDIKLGLKDGTLTLKAGSKLTWGGTEYRTTTTTADQTYSYSGTNEGKVLIFSARSNGAIQGPFVLSRFSSGKLEDRPATAAVESVYYSTDDMKFYYYGSSGWSEWPVAYPLALVTIAGGKITSIDQVFNGFGYIGSTIFALPGVKALIPDGRNDDGTLRNRIVITTGVSILTANGQGVRYTTLANNSKLYNNYSYLYYNEERNIYTSSDGSVQYGYIPVIRYVISDGVITEFKTKLSFRAVDWNDFNKLDSEVAKLDEENTFTNTNTFKAIGLRVKSERYDSNTNPASTQYDAIIYLLDKYGVNLGGVNSYLDTNGNLCIFLQGRRLVNDSVVYSPRLGVTLTPDGVGRTEAFTPPAGDNSSQIATTEWCYDPTKSTNLVHRTGNEDISGIKTFTSEIRRSAPFSGGNTYSVKSIDTNGKGETSTISYYTGSSIYHRFYAKNTTSNKDAFIDVTATDNGASALTFSGSATQKYVNFQGVTKVRVPTPSSSAETGEAVNISYLNSVMPTITYWD